MAYYPEFERLFTIHLNRIDKPKSWVAEQLGVDIATIYRWLNGESRPKDALTVLKIAEVLDIKDIADRKALLKAAGHKEHFANESIATSQTPSAEVAVNDEHDSEIIIQKSFLPRRLAEASSNWEETIVSSMRSIIERSNWGHFLFLLIGLILWQLSDEFIAPTFDMSLSPEQRFTICLSYAIATVVIPIIIGLSTPLQRGDILQYERLLLRYRIKFLQTTGAIVAFHTFLISFLLLAMMWHSITHTKLPGGIQQSMIVASLLMSYVYARKILDGRFQTETHGIKLYSADYLFCSVFVLIGPLTAIGIYYFAEQLSSQPIGMGVLCMLLAFALWQYRKQNTKTLSELGMIAILGIAIPFCLLLIFTLDYSPTLLTSEHAVSLRIFILFFLAETLLVATLLMRNKPTLTIQGMLALLVLAYSAVLVVYLHLWNGYLWVILALFLLVASGRTSFRTYFWVHESFWALQIAAIGSGSLQTIWHPCHSLYWGLCFFLVYASIGHFTLPQFLLL